MIRRSTKIQLLAFVVISLLGISYVGFNYVGLGAQLFGAGRLPGQRELPRLRRHLHQCRGHLPRASRSARSASCICRTTRTTGRRSAASGWTCGSTAARTRPSRPTPRPTSRTVRRSASSTSTWSPPATGAPYLTKGTVLAKPGQVPIATQVLLQNLDDLVSHIDSAKLNTVVTELGNAFNGRGPSLQALLDSGDQLLTAAQQALPETLKLIDDGQIVLKTQLDSGSAIKDWAHNLNLLTHPAQAERPGSERAAQQRSVTAGNGHRLPEDEPVRPERAAVQPRPRSGNCWSRGSTASRPSC